MSNPVAIVENVSKCYHVYNKNIDRLKQAFSFGQKQLYRDFWALRDVSFEVERGDTVGIVGANGSGKSTLLQILFGVLQPSSGKITVDGKVAGLLELGAGFNIEETGRENVLINAAIMGIAHEKIPELFERIEAFADIGNFIDQPVKVYSTGMAVRLGFALQISVPKDILIIDEALAVGDELFQRRCHSALEKFKDDGGTILFVSHSAAAVKQLCRKAIFLDHGRVIQQGVTRIVVENYQKFLYMREPERGVFRDELQQSGIACEPQDPPSAPPAVEPAAFQAPPAESSQTETGVSEAAVHAAPLAPDANVHPRRDQGLDLAPPPPQWDEGLVTRTAMAYQPNGAMISNPRIETLDGQRVNVLNRHERYRFCFRVAFDREVSNVIFGMLVKTTSGVELGGGAHDSPDQYVKHVPAGAIFDVTFEFTACLLPAVYYLNCGVLGSCDNYDGFLHRVIDATAFRMRNLYTRTFAGNVDFDYRTTCRLLKPVTDEAQEDCGAGVELGSIK